MTKLGDITGALYTDVRYRVEAQPNGKGRMPRTPPAPLKLRDARYITSQQQGYLVGYNGQKRMSIGVGTVITTCHTVRAVVRRASRTEVPAAAW